MNSEDVILWARQIKAQRAQAAILNDITEAQKFDKVKLAQKPKGRREAETTRQTYQRHPCKYCGGSNMHPGSVQHLGKSCTGCGKMGSLPKGVHEQKELHSS